MFRNKALAVTLSASLALTGSGAYAWNLICGISVDLAAFDGCGQELAMDTLNELKWESDASAIEGMAAYYMAVANLQRLPLEQHFSGRSMDFTGVKIADEHFSESRQLFATAISQSDQLIGGGPCGLAALPLPAAQNMDRYKQMIGVIDEIRASIDNGHLPELLAVQRGIGILVDYTNSGMEISHHHLEHGMFGHTLGGKSIRIDE